MKARSKERKAEPQVTAEEKAALPEGGAGNAPGLVPAVTGRPPLAEEGGAGAAGRICWRCKGGVVSRVKEAVVGEDGKTGGEASFWLCRACGYKVPVRAPKPRVRGAAIKKAVVDLPDLTEMGGRLEFYRRVAVEAMAVAGATVGAGEAPKSLPAAQAKALEVGLKAVIAIRDEVRPEMLQDYGELDITLLSKDQLKEFSRGADALFAQLRQTRRRTTRGALPAGGDGPVGGDQPDSDV